MIFLLCQTDGRTGALQIATFGKQIRDGCVVGFTMLCWALPAIAQSGGLDSALNDLERFVLERS